MKTLARRFKDFLTEEEWPLVERDDPNLIQTSCVCDAGRWGCLGKIRDDFEVALFYSIFPSLVPEERRAHVAELLARANYQILVGAFDMDMSDGEVRFKTSANMNGLGEVCEQVFFHLVYANIAAMEYYLPAITAVIEGTSPADAMTALA